MPHSPRRRRGAPKAPQPTQEAILTIDHVGHRGDGIARSETGTIFVPNSLSGETVRAAVTGERGSMIEIVTRSTDRIEPFCPHFATCGGCTSQHMNEAAYAAWKRAIVETALGNRGIETPLDPLIDAHGLGRRRATFHARRTAKTWIAGFSGARSHHIVDLDRCPILVPELAPALDMVRTIAQLFPKPERFDAQVTATNSGIDLHLIGIGDVDISVRSALATLADRLDLARISIDGETILARRQPRIQMGLASVPLPPGSFLQATTMGEQVLADLVGTHLSGAKRIADLFAGLGPFALRLATNAAVEAVDSDPAAIAALNLGARAATKLRPIKAEARDLFMRPLLGPELDRFDGVIFDPPRAGAEAQVRILASSKVSTIVAVSCDPATFARDAAILIAGGYRLERVTPVDQFKWSPHIEVVGLLSRTR